MKGVHKMDIKKIEAFEMVVNATEKNDNTMAQKLMRIISKSIQNEKKVNIITNQIQIDDPADVKTIEKAIDYYLSSQHSIG